jgi:subtilisin family serine protease
MIDISNNEVAKRLAPKKSSPIKQVFIETAIPEWKGYPTTSPVEPLYDLEYIKILPLWTEYGVLGQLANVVVIDSGVDATHPSFAHTDIIQKSFLQGVPSGVDQNGHGTWVCGKIVAHGVGIAPNCNLTSYRALDANGSGAIDASIAALKAVLDDKRTNLVNISFGSPFFSQEQKDLIAKLTKQGVIVVAASGNFASDTPFYPGSYPEVLTVSATDKTNKTASFSNFGGQIDIVAPGVGCYSTFLNGEFRCMSGTSMAAPIVTGLLALGVSFLKMVKHLYDRKEIASRVISALEQTAKDLGPVGKDPYTGFGLINGLEFMERLSKK